MSHDLCEPALNSNGALQARKDLLLLILAAFFLTNAVVAEVIGGKLIHIPTEALAQRWGITPFTLSAGILPWPVVFIVTDLVNEYFGRRGVRRLTFIAAIMLAYTFLVLRGTMHVPAASFSPVKDEAFAQVVGQSTLIIVGSITAFLVSQLLDVTVFWLLRAVTGGKMLWLRATGSTVVSQLIDSIVVLGIAFYLPGKITLGQFVSVGGYNYLYKFLIAVAATPILYLLHAVIDRYLGEATAQQLVQRVAEKELKGAL